MKPHEDIINELNPTLVFVRNTTFENDDLSGRSRVLGTADFGWTYIIQLECLLAIYVHCQDSVALVDGTRQGIENGKFGH